MMLSLHQLQFNNPGQIKLIRNNSNLMLRITVIEQSTNTELLLYFTISRRRWKSGNEVVR